MLNLFLVLVWAWIGVDHSPIKRDENILGEVPNPNVDEIIVSRSHAGSIHEVLKSLYRDQQYKIIPAAGSGFMNIIIFIFYYLI